MTYQQYIDAYLRSLVQAIEVFDAQQNTNDADDILIKKEQYTYDTGLIETYPGQPLPPGYLSSYDGVSARGNVSAVTKWTDLATNTSTTKNTYYDKYGNLVKAQVSCCQEKRYTLTQNTYWSKPEQVVSGDPNGVNLTSTAAYDFNSGTMMNETDPNNQTTSYSYDAMARPAQVISPTGASATIGYGAWGPTSSSLSYSEGGATKTFTTSAVYDGWGQVIQEVDENGAQVNTAYDSMGRMISRTNPFPQGGTPGPATTYQYDLLGRVTRVILPGGNTIQTTYSSNTVTVTDQVGRKVKRETDGLGRLVKVTEQDATGALTQDTTYTYDMADNLVQVNQGSQLRAFKYDTAGRLVAERIPGRLQPSTTGQGHSGLASTPTPIGEPLLLVRMLSE